MFRCLLAGFLITCLAAVSHAATTELPAIRNTTLGFGHQFPNRQWTPLRVDLDNPGPEIHATIVIEPSSRAQGQSIAISKPVWLPARSRRTIFLTVFPDVSEAPPIQKPGQEKNIAPAVATVFSAKLTDGSLKVWSQYNVMGKAIPDHTALMLVADSRLTSYRIPSELPHGWSRKPLHRVVLTPRDLPAHAVAYGSVRTVVLGDLGTASLHTMQRSALLDWVRAGGTLVIPATTNPPAFLAPLLPVEFAALDRLATEPRLSRWGPPTIFNDGLLFRRMALRDGTVLAGDSNSPLLAARREGLGSIVTCALDTGNFEFQRWPGATNFNQELISYSLKTIPDADRLFERASGTDTILSSLAGIKVLGRAPLLAYLAFLVAGMIAVLYTFRLTRTPERGWTVVAILAVVTGAVVVVAADRWKGQPQPFLNELNAVAVSPDARQAVVHTALGLYSPRAAAYDLAMPTETVQLRPRTGTGVTPDPFSLRVDADLRVAGLAVRANDMRAMFGQAILPAASQPHARGRVTEAGFELTVSNSTPQSLEDCFFKHNRFVAPLGDLPAGAAKTFRNLETGEAFSSRVVQNAGDELRARIRRLFFPDPVYTLARQRLFDSSGYRERGPGVYAWTDKPLFPATTEQRLARRAVNFWNIETPVTYEGRQLTVPRGFMPLRLKNKDARTVERAEGRYSGTRGSTILAEFSLPAACPDLQITSAKIIVNFRGSAFRHNVQIQSADERRHTALTGDTIPNPAQWYDPATRSLTVKVEIEPVGLAESAAVNYWQIRELDLEIGGTVP
ncbi:MAG: hypothetical protein PCFJNLEI_01888 [Verrucomicrobiae bacterium]|nr:hypothetical protein [Verrucomicrobiae bacterium]